MYAAMIVDGKAIAQNIKEGLKKKILDLGYEPCLAVFLVGDDPVSLRYIAHKRRFAEDAGIVCKVIELPADIKEEDFADMLSEYAGLPSVDAMLIQLPLPKAFDSGKLLALVPPQKDADALCAEPLVQAPVIRAIAQILVEGNVPVADKKVVVVGRGRMVGLKALEWAKQEGAHIVSVDKDTPESASLTENADIIILGAGSPGLLTPDMIKEGVVIVDAGTSEVGGALRGDAAPACADKASLFTPVPGGVGPVTVAMLFANVVDLATRSHVEGN